MDSLDFPMLMPKPCSGGFNVHVAEHIRSGKIESLEQRTNMSRSGDPTLPNFLARP